MEKNLITMEPMEEKNISKIFTDTETETSVDFEKEVEDARHECPASFKSSLFNFTLTRKSLQKSNELESYENRVCEELKTWSIEIKNSLKDLKTAKEKHSIIDWSILPEEKRAYLQREPDLKRVLRILQEARENALKFMDNEYPEMMALKNNIIDLCRQRVNVAKENKLEELLSNNDN